MGDGQVSAYNLEIASGKRKSGLGLTILLYLSLLIILSSGKVSVSEAQERPSWLDDSVTYQWPTNASRYLSATFGETRGRHFHSAIDIGTWGREGYDVYASRSGYLFRASVSAVGYGNAVYLQHDDGSFTLYAHLQDFHPKIRALVDSIRFQDYSFTFDQVLLDHRIYFEQGDVIGLSGSTGVGPPHLHVEVRSPDNVVYNPLLFGFEVPDNIPPQFRSLSVEPKSPNTLINGQHKLFTRNSTPRGGIYDFGSVQVSGPVGLGVNVFDRADGRPNVYAVYELEMLVNGDQVFYSRVDSFSFDHTHQMFLDRVYPILLASRRGFQRLFVKDGNQLPFYKTDDRNGILHLPDGNHTVQIIARDIFGNSSRAQVVLQVENVKDEIQNPKQREINKRVTLSSSESTSVPPENWFWSNNWVQPSDTDNEIFIPGSFYSDISNESEYVLFDDREQIKINDVFLHRIYPDSRATIFTRDQRLSAGFQQGSVYDTMSVGLHWEINEDQITELMVFPNHEPIYQPVTLSFLLPAHQTDNSKLGLYFYLPRSGSYRLTDTQISGQKLMAEITHFDRFYVMEDTLAPEISSPRIYQRRDGKWIASVSVKDNLSGIDYNSAEFYSNGIRGIPEYDPENDLIRYHHTDFEPLRENILRIRVSDKMGNTSEAEFHVPHP